MGKREIEGRPLADLAFSPRFPAMTGDNPPDVGQSDARSFKFAFGMQSLKYAKELGRVLHVEARAVVSHVKFIFGFLNPATHLDLRLLFMSRVFHCVG